MKWLIAYVTAGIFLTAAWNVQVQAACGRPMTFLGLLVSPMVLPLLTPMMLWNDTKPACERMKLAMPPADRESEA